MLYRRLAVLSLVVILGYAIAGCGGGGKGITQSLSQQSTSGPVSMNATAIVTSEQADWARKAAGLHRNLEFTYSTIGYPAADGFTAVALNENYEQFAAGEQDFSITVSDMAPNMKSVKLAADRHIPSRQAGGASGARSRHGVTASPVTRAVVPMSRPISIGFETGSGSPSTEQ